MAIYNINTLKTLIENYFIPGTSRWTGLNLDKSLIDTIETLNYYLPNENPLLIKYGLNIKAFGNSITEGSQSNPFSNSYIEYLNSFVGGTLTNLGVQGQSSTQALTLINQNNELPTNRTNLTTWMLGVNDIIFSLSQTAKYANTDAAKEFLCNAFAKTITPSTSATEIGTWSNWASGTTYGGRTGGRMTTTANDEISVSLGTNSTLVFVVLFTNPETDTENWATEIEVTYPGYQQTFNINKTRNKFGHYTILIDTHAYKFGGTLKVKNLSGGKMVVDYFGDCKLPKDCYPAIVYDTTYCSDYWYANGNVLHASGVNDLWFDECNIHVRDMVNNEFRDLGYPCVVVKSNKYFNPETMTPNPNSSDGIHPTNEGHRAIHKASREAIQLVPII